MKLTPGSFVFSLLGGLIAGAIDIIYACIYNYLRLGTRPGTVFQSVASGVFGREAFTGGPKMVLLGRFFHFLIAIIAAVIITWQVAGFDFLSPGQFSVGLSMVSAPMS